LRRLKPPQRQNRRAQLATTLLIAATRLDPDAIDAMLPQPTTAPCNPQGYCRLQPPELPIERDIELPFAGIDPGADRGTLGLFVDPSL